MSLLFTRFGPYEIKRRLRRGGMGVVYLAHDLEGKEDVALKLVEEGDDRDSRQAIEAEEYGVKLQQALYNVEPSVPAVKDFGSRDGYFFIAMEYIEGEDLSDRIERGRLPYDEVIRIARAICRTLHAAHTLRATIDGRSINQIVHGDIKPTNIRLTPQGGVKLLDFGIAKALSLTRKLTVNDFGTAAYCSPERLDTGHINVPSDLWSFGILLYEMSSGAVPFRASSQRELERLIISGPPLPPLPDDCPALLRDFIVKALTPDPRARFQSAAEMKYHLDSETKYQGDTDEQGATRRVRGGGAGQESPGAKPGTSQSGAHVSGVRPGAHVGATGRGDGSRQSGTSTAPRRFHPLTLSAVALAATIILSFAGFAAYEGLAWRAKKQLRDELAGASFSRFSDTHKFWNRYKEVSEEGWLGWGMDDLRAGFKQKLADLAGRAIKEYQSGKPVYSEGEWKDARDCLSRIAEMGAADSQLNAMSLYCEGHLERIQGDGLKKKKSPDAAAKYSDAIRHFTAAAEAHPQWPDPHLALAIVYTYGPLDAGRAAEALDEAKERGLVLGEREVAIRADGLRMTADKLYDELRKGASASAGDCARAKELYQQALEKYQSIPNFSADTRQYIKALPVRVQELQQKLETLSGAGSEVADEGDGS